MPDTCGYAALPSTDPRSLACDYSGLMVSCPCDGAATDDPATAVLETVTSVAELRAAWNPLADEGLVDSLGGAEYHHALAHLRAKIGAEEKTVVALIRQLKETPITAGDLREARDWIASMPPEALADMREAGRELAALMARHQHDTHGEQS
jgi:hypothetical protein